MSSISGSESDSEEEDFDSDSGGGRSSNVNGTDDESSTESSSITGRPLSRIVFQNSAGQYLSVYRCTLQGKVRLSSRYNTEHCVICIRFYPNVMLCSLFKASVR